MASSAWKYNLPPLWSVKEFIHATDNGWGRSHLKRIDKKLGWAKDVEQNPPQYVAALAQLVDECREWMISKEKKFQGKAKTGSYQKRLQAVTTLMGQAMTHLKFYAFDEQKLKGASSQAVNLKPGYSREREEFEQMKAANSWNHGLRLDPRSGSYVTVGLTHLNSGRVDMRSAYWDRGIAPILDAHKTVVDLSDDEFVLMSQQLKKHYNVQLEAQGFLQRVHYVRKLERINNYMLIPISGLLYKNTGHHPHTTPGRKELYAIDKYGNLMTAAADEAFDDGTFRSEHRHSSLNAGNAVTCAGYITIVNGKITYIDNRSGHYKPSLTDLARAVVTLINQHSLNLNETQIDGYTATGVNSLEKTVNALGSSQYLRQVIPPPPIPPSY